MLTAYILCERTECTAFTAMLSSILLLLVWHTKGKVLWLPALVGRKKVSKALWILRWLGNMHSCRALADYIVISVPTRFELVS